MFAYSTNPSVRTQYSVQKEREEKALRIANEYYMSPSIQNAMEEYFQERITLADLEQRCDSFIYKKLHLNNADRAKRLHNLRNAVRRILVNMRYDYEDMRMKK